MIKNFNANGLPEVPPVVVIPVTIPVNPEVLAIPLITSFGAVGIGAITCGGFDLVYPNPGFVTVTLVIIPAVIFAVPRAIGLRPTLDIGVPVVGIPIEMEVVVPTSVSYTHLTLPTIYSV